MNICNINIFVPGTVDDQLAFAWDGFEDETDENEFLILVVVLPARGVRTGDNHDVYLVGLLLHGVVVVPDELSFLKEGFIAITF